MWRTTAPGRIGPLPPAARVLDFARGQPELLQRVENTGKLPMNELVEGTGVERKTLERHRKYLAAILLAFTNGYEIIRSHLCQVGSQERRRPSVKYLVMETHPAYAVVLDNEGRFLKAANLHYQVGTPWSALWNCARQGKKRPLCGNLWLDSPDWLPAYAWCSSGITSPTSPLTAPCVCRSIRMWS